jgi:hypothetical protein
MKIEKSPRRPKMQVKRGWAARGSTPEPRGHKDGRRRPSVSSAMRSRRSGNRPSPAASGCCHDSAPRWLSAWLPRRCINPGSLVPTNRLAAERLFEAVKEGCAVPWKRRRVGPAWSTTLCRADSRDELSHISTSTLGTAAGAVDPLPVRPGR